MSSLKTFKKGETILREGEKNAHIYIIQTGSVSISATRENKKLVELFRVGGGQVIGDEALSAGLPAPWSAVAITETRVYEIPVEPLKLQLEQGANQMFKLLIKGLVEKQKTASNELKNFRLEQDPSPCPPDNIAKVFGVIFHVAQAMGTKKDGKVTVSWPGFKKYAQRVFLESPLRLEQAMYVLVKLKMAEKQMVKSDIDPTAPEELGFFHISDLGAVERFFDFYQNYHFKPGYTNLLKYDEKCTQTAKALLDATQGERVDQKGAVYMNYKTTLDKVRASLGQNFNADGIERLQQKGLFVKRESSATGGTISFIKPEFETMIQNWKIIKEIEKWNELGHVDMTEPKPVAAPQAAQAATAEGPVITCPSCLGIVASGQKFCGQCGQKLAVAA